MKRFPISTTAPLEYRCQPQADFSHRHLREDAQLELSGVSRQGNMSTTPIVVLQRIRNRIIEYLELASSFDAQTRYHAAAPGVRVPNEVLNQWEDWADGDWLQYEPAFTPDEIGAMRRFQRVWEDVCNATPSDLPDLDELLPTPSWRQLAAGAEQALAVFMRSGPRPEFDR